MSSRASTRSGLWLASLLGVGAIGAVGAVGGAAAATGSDRSPAVYPPQSIPLRFDHAVHLEEGADCEACHDAVLKSLKASDVAMPRHPECDSCHDIEAARRGKKVEPRADCAACHVGYDPTARKDVAKVVMPTANLLFPHQVHVDRKVECAVCHGDFSKVGFATVEQLPKMATCLSCHDDRTAPAACHTCHPAKASGRLVTSFASGILRPIQGDPFGIDHGPRFDLSHGPLAALERTLCQSCHLEADCQRCHDAMQKPLSVHPNDYLTLHPIQARMDSLRCESCHRYQSFCLSCHERSGVGYDADRALRPLNVRVHPDYNAFVNDTTSPLHHGIAAARGMSQCISCHREDTCLVCHSATGARKVNPHPEGFGRGCKALLSKNDRPCAKCHDVEALRVDSRCQ